MGIWSTVGTALKNTISGSSKTNVEQISFDEKEEETKVSPYLIATGLIVLLGLGTVVYITTKKK